METRMINGTVHAGTDAQLDLFEEYEILFKGNKVIFNTERGERVGTVVGYGMYGGGSSPWGLSLYVKYRGSEYPVRAESVQLA